MFISCTVIACRVYNDHCIRMYALTNLIPTTLVNCIHFCRVLLWHKRSSDLHSFLRFRLHVLGSCNNRGSTSSRTPNTRGNQPNGAQLTHRKDSAESPMVQLDLTQVSHLARHSLVSIGSTYPNLPGIAAAVAVHVAAHYGVEV
jgi:hypothetical protein